MSKAPRPEAPTFQEIILRLQRYWADNGCVVMQPYDNEVGAGTFHGHHAAPRWAPTPGVRATCSRAADRLTAAMAKTRTACSTTTSSRCS